MNSRHSSSRGRKRGSKSTSNTKPITSTTTTKSTGPYDRAFEQNLIDGGVYPDEYEYPDGRIPPQPNNWEEINRRLTQPRSSLSPSRFSDEDFRRFRRAQAHAPKEKQVTTSVIPIVEGEIGDAKCSSGGIQFTNLAHLTDGTIVPGNPDLYYGARPEQLDRRVRKELSRHIIPSTQDSLPTAPNFFLAVKGPDGSLTVAGRQACYDGALGARGIHSLQEYGQDEAVYDNNAYTITSIYYDGYLKMYTSHPTQPSSPGGRPEYFMNQLRSFAMTDTTARFREGAAAFRNARDWTKEKRNEFIDAANARRANDSQAETSAIDASGFGLTSSLASEVSLAEPYSTESLGQESRTSLNEDFNTASHLQESETSTDELVLDYRLPAKRSTKHSKREHQPQRKRRDTGDSSGA